MKNITFILKQIHFSKYNILIQLQNRHIEFLKQKYLRYILILGIVSFLYCNLYSSVLENNPRISLKANICTTWKDIENRKNEEGIITGIFQNYTPIGKGKGAKRKYWKWELLLSDKTTIPILSNNADLMPSKFLKQKVKIYGTIFYGIIVGTKEGQHAIGYRIDMNNIEKY